MFLQICLFYLKVDEVLTHIVNVKRKKNQDAYLNFSELDKWKDYYIVYEISNATMHMP